MNTLKEIKNEYDIYINHLFEIKKEIAEKATSEEIKTISEFINMELKLSQHITY